MASDISAYRCIVFVQTLRTFLVIPLATTPDLLFNDFIRIFSLDKSVQMQAQLFRVLLAVAAFEELVIDFWLICFQLCDRFQIKSARFCIVVMTGCCEQVDHGVRRPDV